MNSQEVFANFFGTSRCLPKRGIGRTQRTVLLLRVAKQGLDHRSRGISGSREHEKPSGVQAWPRSCAIKRACAHPLARQRLPAFIRVRSAF
eukprot:6182661-Pleurochrysis_carterae.AAC.4